MGGAIALSLSVYRGAQIHVQYEGCVDANLGDPLREQSLCFSVAASALSRRG